MEAGDYQVEYAKSGRARCRLTGNTIPNKALRIGEIVEGDYGTYPRWMNFDDFEKDYDACLAFKNSGTRLHGLSSLKQKDKERVNAILAGSLPTPSANLPPSQSYQTNMTPQMSSGFSLSVDPNVHQMAISQLQPFDATHMNSVTTSVFQQPSSISSFADTVPSITSASFPQKKKRVTYDTAPMFSAPRPIIQHDAPIIPPRQPAPVQIPMKQVEPFTSMTQPRDTNDINGMLSRLTSTELQLVLTRMIMNDPNQMETVKKHCMRIFEARKTKPANVY
jgi:hypothetical protein